MPAGEVSLTVTRAEGESALLQAANNHHTVGLRQQLLGDRLVRRADRLVEDRRRFFQPLPVPCRAESATRVECQRKQQANFVPSAHFRLPDGSSTARASSATIVRDLSHFT